MSTPGDYSQQGGPPKPRGTGVPTWVFILGGLWLFLVFGGILAVLAISGLRKYIASAKTAEARNSVAQIGRDAVSAYAGGRLCASASQTVPDRLEKITGRKYQSGPTEWDADQSTKSGFYCLKFSMSSPQYYLYDYRAHGTSAAGDGFEASAHGDLDGDGAVSDFKLTGQIGASGSLELAPRIVELNPTE